MVKLDAEITPSLGLGGLLLGQSAQNLAFEESWNEGEGVSRANLAGGVVQVVVSAGSTIIGLVAEAGYQGKLPAGVGVGSPLDDALVAYPQLRRNDLDGSLYEPDRLAFVLHPDDENLRVSSILVCDWAHDYWAYSRPLLSDEEWESSF